MRHRVRRMQAGGVTIRRALVPELQGICAWIEPRFGAGWAAEATAAIMRQPVTCWIAHEGETLLGFACSLAAALLLSVLIDFSRPLRRALVPVFVISQTLPLVAIAPLVVLWSTPGDQDDQF